IPGTIGGLICMNGGSQRKGIGESVIQVHSVDRNGAIVIRRGADCNFEYRNSIYQSADEILLSARLKFNRSISKFETRRRMLSILSERRKKFPQKYPNCGSVFKSNPSMYEVVGPPGQVIESLGFKGMKSGGAMVSPQHANFIVNTG